MYRSNYDFPHPVLFEGNEDYVNSSFEIVVVDESNNPDFFTLSVEYCLDSIGLKELVKTKRASVVIRVESPSASYRTLCIYTNNETKMMINIRRNDVAKELILKGFVVANECIENFLLDEHNREYFNTPFSIDKGDVLAYEPGRKIYLDDSELEKPISSIITIAENNETSDHVLVDLNDDKKIKVLLDKDTYSAYWTLRVKPELKKYLAGLVVLPAVCEAIEKLKINLPDEEDQLLSDKIWYRVIKKKLNEKNYDDDDIQHESTLKMANTLLGNVVNNSLGSLYDTFEREFDNLNINMMGGNE